jgi:hypothetical protein
MKKSSKRIGSINLFLKLLKKQFLFLSVLFLFSSEIISQTDTVYVRSDIYPLEGNLNKAVEAVIDSGSLSNTVFELEQKGYYVLTDSILVPAGEHLTIIAPEPGLKPETAPPQILVSINYRSNYTFYSNGNITLKNIWLLYAASDGWQRHVNLQFESKGETEKLEGIFENVIFDFSAVPGNSSGAVGLTTRHFKGYFKNCYWKNCTDQHFRYYGRAISFPYEPNTVSDWHIDTLAFENCSFANIGYVYMQENTHYADYVKFNH